MPHYFFNIYDGREVFDDVGIELAGRHEIQDHMMTVARAWIEQEDHWDSHWRLEARDDSDNIVGSMSFGVKLNDS